MTDQADGDQAAQFMDLMPVLAAPGLLMELGHQRYCPVCKGRGGGAHSRPLNNPVFGVMMYELEWITCPRCLGVGTIPYFCPN